MLVLAVMVHMLKYAPMGWSRRQDPSAGCNPADSGERGCGGRAQARARVPIACEDVWRAEAEPAGAEAQGRWGEASDLVPVPDGGLQGLCSDAVRGWRGALRAQAYGPARGFLRPFACATEVEGRQQVLTPWAQAISPCVRRVVRVRRKTAETEGGRESGHMTAASAAYLNNALQLTARSLRCAPASGSS